VKTLKKSNGFTLVELMMTIAILAILTALALPSYRDFMRKNMVVNEANRLIASLQLARTKSLTGSFRGGVCTSSGPTALCAGGSPNAYQNGYNTFFIVDQGDVPTVIEFSPLANNGMVQLVPSTTALGRVQFDRLGRLDGIPNNVTGVQFTACFEGLSSLAVPGVNIFVARSGRVTSFPIVQVGPCLQNANQN